MTRRSFAWAALIALAVTATARADDQKVAGTWTWTFNRNGEDVTTTLKLKQDAGKLTGTVKGQQGNETEIKEGTIKNGEVSFKVERERDGNVFTVHYTGKLDGASIKGKSEMTANGETRSRDWEAKRSAD